MPGREPTGSDLDRQRFGVGWLPTSSPRTLTRVGGEASIPGLAGGPRRSGQGAERVSGLDLVPLLFPPFDADAGVECLEDMVEPARAAQDGRLPSEHVGQRSTDSRPRAAVRSPPTSSAGRKARGTGACRCPPRSISDLIFGAKSGVS
jgi:hypothetical protein